PSELTSLVISPSSASLSANATQQFIAKAYDQYNYEIATGTAYVWEVTDATAGTIASSTGLFTAGSIAGTYTDTIKVTGTYASSTKIAYASVTITGGGFVDSPNLTITKSANPDDATILMPGDIITYTLSYKNTGNAQATNVIITDDIPAGTTYVSDSGGVLASSTVSFEIGTLGANGSGEVSFQVKVNDPEEVDYVVNKAIINSDQTAPKESNQLSHGIDPFTFTKKAEDLNGGQVLSGDTILYTLTVTNIGVVPTTNIIITDDIPTHTAYVVGSIAGIGADDSNPIQLKWIVGSLAVDQSVDLTFQVIVDDNLPNNTTISNSGTLNSDQVSSKISSDAISGGSTDIVVELSVFKWCEKEQQNILEIEWSEERCVSGGSEIKQWCEKEQQNIPETEWSEERCVSGSEDGDGDGDENEDDTLTATEEEISVLEEKSTEETFETILPKKEVDYDYKNKNNFAEKVVAVAKVIKKTAPVVSITGLGVSIFAALFTDSLFLLRLWASLLAFFGIRKKKPWGVVYDSETKQPIDPAYIQLFDKNTGVKSGASITDMDGRYGFAIRPSTYYITVNKTHYQFPSQKLAGQQSDGMYDNLYFGEDIVISDKDQIITQNIPIDRIGFDWNEYVKEKKKLMIFYKKCDYWLAIISNVFFTIGFIMAAIALCFAASPYNIIIFLFYILILILSKTLFKSKQRGTVEEKSTRYPLSFGIIRAYSVSTNIEIGHTVIDETGKYYFLIANGEYYVSIEKKNNDGSYSKVYISKPFVIKDGIINKNFAV
ncbi:DUF11 domain-containing protein, partial [Patescibacteria group bacterium]|nr:DUF11 domain-containing protein [Patescibacteria group bacterium]